MSTALLVIDVQRIYTDSESEMKCPDSSATVKRINRLIAAFEKSGEPIVFVRHIHKANGSDLGRMFDYAGDEVDDFNFKDGTEEVEYDERLERPKSSREIKKCRYSAFAGTALHKHLKTIGAERVAICGFMTNFCCESTARSAHDLDYFVDFVLDATGTPGTETMKEPKVRRIVGELLEEGFACVVSTDEYLENE